MAVASYYDQVAVSFFGDLENDFHRMPFFYNDFVGDHFFAKFSTEGIQGFVQGNILPFFPDKRLPGDS